MNEGVDPKLDKIIQRQEDLENADVPEGEVRQPPPPPPSHPVGLKRFYGKTKDHKTLCLLCNHYMADIDRHLTTKSNCFRTIKNLGLDVDPDEQITSIEEAFEPYFGAMIIGSFLNLMEDYLRPDHKEMSQAWQDKMSVAFQRFAEKRMGELVHSDSIVILVGFCEYAMVQKDGLRKKFKSKELPDDLDAARRAEGGPSAPGFRGDSGDREDADSSGIS